jgi:hypothetical protein
MDDIPLEVGEMYVAIEGVVEDVFFYVGSGDIHV